MTITGVDKIFIIVVSGSSNDFLLRGGRLDHHGEVQMAQAANYLGGCSQDTLVIAGPGPADIASAQFICDTLSMRIIKCLSRVTRVSGINVANTMENYQNCGMSSIAIIDAITANECIQHIRNNILGIKGSFISASLPAGSVIFIPCHDVKGHFLKGDLIMP